MYHFFSNLDKMILMDPLKSGRHLKKSRTSAIKTDVMLHNSLLSWRAFVRENKVVRKVRK